MFVCVSVVLGEGDSPGDRLPLFPEHVHRQRGASNPNRALDLGNPGLAGRTSNSAQLIQTSASLRGIPGRGPI